MKKLLFLFIIIIISACTDSNQMSDELSEKYIAGKVIIRAEKHHPIGMIKIKDIFSDDDDIESPSRAILYRYESDNSSEPHEFDLNENVYFKASIVSNMQMATCIKRKIKDEEKESMKNIYSLLDKFDINLHNADSHREGPQHRIKHRTPNTTYSLQIQGSNIDLVNLIDPNVPGSEGYMFIKDTPVLHVNTDYFLYVTDADVPTHSHQNINIIDKEKVYIISPSHNHTH